MPDIAASKDDAPRVAQLEALDKLIAEGDPSLKGEREKRKAKLKSEEKP